MAVSANAVVGIFLTQLDKVMLSRLVTLEQFGFYILAGLVASIMWAIILPVNTALFPRLVQLHEQRDDASLAAFYHKACQFMAVTLLPIAMLLIFFPYELLYLWTRDESIARSTALLVTLLTFGTTLNGISSVPGYLQSAAGWPGLILRTNAVLALLLVPAMLVVVPRFGPMGAAAVWVAVNCTYLMITVPVMHRRLLRGELARWYAMDVLIPTAAVVGVGVPMRILMPLGWSGFAQVAFLVCAWAIATGAVLLVTPKVRPDIGGFLYQLLGKVGAARRIGISG
jgi:O-antigen/teichoic acid export membrane protein